MTLYLFYDKIDAVKRKMVVMQYETVYSGRKTISLCVKNQQLIVRAPYGTSERKISELVEKHKNWILNRINKQSIPRAKDVPLNEDQIAELKKKAKIILKEKTEHFSRIMGIKYGRITITSAKTRFGSCSSKGNLSFSWLLMLYPEAAIDYVVVHELAHILEMNHSPRFYKIVEKFMPDYKTRRALLKQ